MTMLELQSVTASYGAAQALFGVELTIAEGDVHALMGRNGMGKSTTVKTICGLLPAKGIIRFEGAELTSLQPHRIARLGIGLVPEGRRCFANLSVEENLLAAARPGHWTFNTIAQLFPRLEERRTQSAATLSGGEQQMLAISRALMTNPKLLILDEATEGLAPVIRQEIWKAIASLKEETGMAILLIDKSIRELGLIADRGTILQRGKSVWSGTFEELTPEISNLLIGV